MAVSKNVTFNLEVIEVTKQHFSQNSLRSRRLEVVGEKENGRARGRHARGEGAPAWKANENHFNSHSVSAEISNWSRGSRGKKLPRGARKLSINSTWTT